MRRIISTLALVLMLAVTALPAHAQSPQDAAAEVEAAIRAAMPQAGTGSGPTLGQLGGVQAGATASDAGGGAGGDGGDGGGGGGGSSCCFLAGTQVAMADGTSRPIEAVKVGDMVLSFDPETGKTSHEKVLALESPVRDHHYVMTFADGTVLKLTDEHPLWAMVDGVKGWASINPANSLKHDNMKTLPLKVGDKVYAMGGEWVAIAGLERVEGDVLTYNLSEISNTHTYLVSPAMEDGRDPFALTGRERERRRVVHNKSSR